MSALPETVGRFRIGAPLRAAEGSRLFSATDLDTGRHVVLRLFARDSDAWRRAFMTRTTQLTALQHPHLARVVAGGTDATHAWWAYDDTSISTLDEQLASDTPPPLDRCLSMLAEVCRAAAHAWAQGVTFLDLRPAWLWIAADGNPLVAGYRPPPTEGRDVDTGMTHADVLRHASPEEVLGTQQDARSVVFTLGIVLHEVVTGQRLFDGDRPVDLAQQILYGKVPTLVLPLERDLPGRTEAALAALNPVLARALARRPEDRYVSLADFADALDAVARDLRPHEPPAMPAAAPMTSPSLDLDSPEPLPVYDDHVQFTVYRPRAVRPDTWETLLVFAHLDALPPDAPPDAPDPVAEVDRQARTLLGSTGAHGRQTVDSDHAVPREGLLLVVPYADGIEFNPPTAAFQWLEAVHREEFRLRARPAVTGQTVRGRITVFLGSIILAEIPLTLRVGDVAAATAPPVRDSARPYRRIFASYSHRDQPIVEEFSRYAEAIGDQYLLDVVHLRAGEHWGDGLKALIRQADVFQLFWSWHALESPYVREEWQYALSLQRPSFIRPVYWDDPLPEAAGLPPEALRALHFERIRPTTVQVATPSPRASAAPPADDAFRVDATDNVEDATEADPPARPPGGVTRLMRYGGPIAAVLVLVVLLLPLRNELRDASTSWTGNAHDAIEPSSSDTTPHESGEEPPKEAVVPPPAQTDTPPPPPPPPPVAPRPETPPAAKNPRPGRPDLMVPGRETGTSTGTQVLQGPRVLDVDVRGAGGVVLPNARLELRVNGDDASLVQVATDARGHATLRLRADTRYTVVVTHTGYRSVTRLVQPGVAPVTLAVTLPARDQRP